jgi:cyclic pyranopterin phosphate synthase
LWDGEILLGKGIVSAYQTLRDSYGRYVDRLRISVTGRCNYRCIFCHFEGLSRAGPEAEALTADDYSFIAYVLRKYGVRYHKLTGGEPLIREDIHQVVSGIKQYAEEVSLVTNGSFLLERAGPLAEAGLDRLNVSLHSLRYEVYEYITGGSKLLSKVLKGVDEALDRGIRVKVNFLLMKSNIDDLPRVLDYAESKGLDVNVIELVPLGVPAGVYSREHLPTPTVLNIIQERSIRTETREFQNRPVYVLRSGIRVEVVIGYGNKFLCAACTRMRLTPDGNLKTCLYAEKPTFNIVEAVKRRDEEMLTELFKKAVLARKPFFS